MKKMLWLHGAAALLLCLSLSGCGTKSDTKRVETETQELLQTWCDSLLKYQLTHKSEALDGAILCPSCGIIHGRCADAVYPLLYLSDLTGDAKYRDAAIKVFNWGRRNVRMPDGAWSNEVNISGWKGITVFGLIALAEAYKDFQDQMDTATRRKWYNTIVEQADFISHYLKPGRGNINYTASACYALALSAEVTGDDKYRSRAAELAALIPGYFTPNDHFLYGEGVYPYHKSPKGLLPVDLGYNVEESLPNLLLYADLVKDDSLKRLVKRSMDTHIEFMLPDGGWDNSWGTRNFKWTYWGSRTSDGVLLMCSVLAPENPVYAEIGYRNFDLLRRCSPDGLLYGGAHYGSAGYRACLHHTFDHAKCLALALKHGFGRAEQSVSIPRDAEYGAKHFKDIDTWLVAHGDWRATVTGYDVDYHILGGNPHGGALTVLWNEKTGPLLATGMTQYKCEEPANMQMLRGMCNYTGGMTVQYAENGRTYRNTSYRDSEITHEKTPAGERITILTGLETIDYKAPESGPLKVRITYEFADNDCVVTVQKMNPGDDREIELFIPVISPAMERYELSGNLCRIDKPYAQVLVEAEGGELRALPVEANGRAFLPTPGFEFIPLTVGFNMDATVKIGVM